MSHALTYLLTLKYIIMHGWLEIHVERQVMITLSLDYRAV